MRPYSRCSAANSPGCPTSTRAPAGSSPTACRASQTSVTSRPSGGRTSSPSTSTSAATPASRSPSPAGGKEPRMSGTSGPSLPVPLGFYDPESRSLRTSRTTFGSASTLSCATLPTSGSMLSGALYARTPLALRTSAAGSSSSPQLPTPRARDSRGRGFEDALPNVVRLLPTPRTSDTNGVGAHGEGGPDLRTAISLLPTPRASDGEKGGPNQRGSKGDLALPSAVVQLLPTPRVAAGRTGRSAIERSSSSPSLEQAVELANGETPRELEHLAKVPPSWSGGSSPRRSRGGKRRPVAVPPGQLTIGID